jgi:zinc D-Ala-D-Ala carboxypeptidase
MKLSEHFSITEMTKSQTGERKGIDNTPTDEQVENLKALCANVLEKIRAHFGKPITVNSGFRGAKLNKAIGGAKNSSHLHGEAADIEIAGVDNLQLVYWIANNLEFDQLISEFYNPGDPQSGWVHVSWSRNKNRNQKLTINKSGTKSGLPTIK